MAEPLDPNVKIACAVGAIVLTSQEIERLFKFLVPFQERGDSSVGSQLWSHARLHKKSLGEVAGRFLEATEDDSNRLADFLGRVVKDRNEVVHHFQEHFGAMLGASRHEDVLSELHARHERMADLHRLLRELAVSLAEIMRDTTFAGTPEQEEMTRLCEKARVSLPD